MYIINILHVGSHMRSQTQENKYKKKIVNLRRSEKSAVKDYQEEASEGRAGGYCRELFQEEGSHFNRGINRGDHIQKVMYYVV